MEIQQGFKKSNDLYFEYKGDIVRNKYLSEVVMSKYFVGVWITNIF